MKSLEVVEIAPPPESQRVCRDARFAADVDKPTRYHLPRSLASASPVGYRKRISLTSDEASQALRLLELQPPDRFAPGPAVTEQELFEETSLGVLTSRQSTNFRGFQQVTFDAEDSLRIAELLGLPHDNIAYTHVVLSRPYRTPFTFLLTFVGHRPLASLLTTPWRALKKRFMRADDIPSIGFLQHLHVGFLMEAMSRAVVLASAGTRMARLHSLHAARNEELEAMCGASDGYRVALVAQVGYAPTDISRPLCRKLGANLLAFRSERIQPGVNAEASAPEGYRRRQTMDVPERLTEMAGRAATNAFTQWTGLEREQAKRLLLVERIDVLTPEGKERIREVRRQLERVTERVAKRLPLWADLPLARALSKNTLRGKKAFALAGQRIYIGGLSRAEVHAAGLDWTLALRAFGAAVSRASLYVELMGVLNIPAGCDLLLGSCVMAGPVNQNDIGKLFYGEPDLLAGKFAARDPTSLLVWTLKAKTIADPIGNEEQLMNPARKGALVDLRPGPHEVVRLCKRGHLVPMRGSPLNEERAFADAGNFVTDENGRVIAGNAGTPWRSPAGTSAFS